MRSKHDKLRGAKPVSRYFNVFTRLCIEPVVRHAFKLTAINAQILPKTGPAIIVANHVNLFDPPWIYSVVKRPVHFVATEELFRKTVLSAAIRLAGVFPIRKAARDFQSVKNIINLLREGVLIGIYPEGNRSWDGTNNPIIPTIARLIRRMKVPVYSCRVDGGYLHFPRWAAKMRPVPVRLVFNKLYESDTLPNSEAPRLGPGSGSEQASVPLSPLSEPGEPEKRGAEIHEPGGVPELLLDLGSRFGKPSYPR